MKFIYSLFMIMLLASCSGSGSVIRQIGNTDGFTDLTAQDDVFIDALGVLPLDISGTGKYTVRVNNNSPQNYTLASVQVGAEQAEPWAAASKLLRVDATTCGKLAADSSCDLQLTPYASTSADVLISITLHDIRGNQKIVKQMVRMSQDVKSSNGFTVVNDLNNLITKDGAYSLALPVILERDFESVNALNGYLRCQNPGFRQGNHCSYLIKGKALADNTLLTTQLTGFAAGKKIAQTQANILIRNKPAANLVLSHGVRLITDGRTTSDLSIYNNGRAPAPFKVSIDAGVDIVAGQGCLTQALAVQSECRLSLRSNGKQGHRASAFIIYYDEKSVSTTLNYISPAQASLINISTSNSLQNTPVSASNQQILTITNTSNNNLNGIAVSIAGAKPTHLILGLLAQAQGGCDTLNDITLAAGASCRVSLQYSPVERENATTQLQVSVAAAEQKAEIYSYYIDYSAIKPTNYLAISQIKNVTLAATGSNRLEEESFSLINLAPAVALQLNQVILEDLSAQLKLNPNSCAVGTILDEQHPQCVGRIDYSSVISEATSKSAHLAVLYALKNIDNSHVYAQGNSFTFARESGTVGPINPDPVSESGIKIIESFVVEVSGDGATVQKHELASEPYRVFAERGKDTTITLKYTFTNIGSESTANFTVDSSSLIRNFNQSLNKLPTYGSTNVIEMNNCSKILHSKGGSCTLQLKWSGKFIQQHPVEDIAQSSRFVVELKYCYDNNLGKNLCAFTLKGQTLEITLGWVSDFSMHILYHQDQSDLLDLWDEDKYVKGQLVLDFNKQNFSINGNNITIKIGETIQTQIDNDGTFIEESLLYGEGSCKLSHMPCILDVVYPRYMIFDGYDDLPPIYSNVPLEITGNGKTIFKHASGVEWRLTQGY